VAKLPTFLTRDKPVFASFACKRSGDEMSRGLARVSLDHFGFWLGEAPVLFDGDC